MNPTSSRATGVITIGAFFRLGSIADILREDGLARSMR
jgi:hypothetical protein